MNVLFHLANGLVLPPALFFAYNFYKFKGSEIHLSRQWISLVLLSITVVVTSLQFVFPAIIPALDRNWDALRGGEWWRLITPLFIQPMGIWQCVFNGLFFVAFVPIAESLYGYSLVLIYFGAGLVGQLVNLYWQTTPGGLATGTGGSSTALYGVIGSLLVYILTHRKTFPKGYELISIAGLLGASILILFEDGHAPSLLAGGLLGWLLRTKSQSIPAYPQASH